MCLVQLIEQPITNPEIMQQIICLFTFWVLLPSRYHNISTLDWGNSNSDFVKLVELNKKILIKNFVKYLSKISSNICQKNCKKFRKKDS